MEKQLTEKESLAIIQTMIAEAKSNIKDDGFFFLLWGWLVLVASLSHYLLLAVLQFEHHYLPWPVLMIFGAIISIIKGIKEGKKQKVKTYFDQFMKYLWIAFMVVLIIVLFFSTKLGWDGTYPIIILLYGMGTFITGGALNFKPLIFGGIACWILAIFAFFMSFENQLLIIALAIVLSYIIPGHILKAKA